MNTKSRKLSAWYYGLGALVFVAGCLLTAVILFQGAKELPGLIKKAYDLDRLAQVVVPGSTELTLTRTGVYGVYYEYRSSVDGVQYMGGQTPPILTCSIISNASGKEIPVVPDFVDTNRYSGGGGSYKERREGVLVMSTTIAKTRKLYILVPISGWKRAARDRCVRGAEHCMGGYPGIIGDS